MVNEMGWRLSGNLKVIAADIKTRLGPVTIGSIGDKEHRERKSDHNPDNRQVVCAIDVMFNVGPKASAVVKALIGRSDIAYIIHNHTIWSQSHGWKARKYTGTKDPHTNHVHVSTLHTSAADTNRTHLKWAATAPKPGNAKPTLKSGSKGAAVKTLQTKLNAKGHRPALKVDGEFGPATLKAVKWFQGHVGLGVDGIVGPKTWAKLG
jgi:murein L,D-transpeptidase YcbB/YkuD